MIRRLLVPFLCVAVLSSGCMTLGMALTDPKSTPRSHVIAGGLLGDGAIAAVANAAKSESEASTVKPGERFLTYFGVLVAVDAIGAGVVWYLRRPKGDQPR
jgi:hypothetical protein